ncbi:polysaccharide deacetylase family protein [Yeosuana sp. MJ-SS3]|uniref:Polysaccharide deacetylase family protein n=1 Tax=Gilvirhabdus luticola TaxID=3079858 RepID=A0ABU3U8E8_9FLAO|nr:polysaccharide deacetylase family protein [Yeosuana sp. MJ-SS3]MDU8886666.1 polysaccharide deacetylase family protein [Yeosuana sp. MJ-SS3]
MSLTPVKIPILVKKMFPNYIWDIPSETNTIYITFDDGPTPGVTDLVLDILKTYNAKATFFSVGENAIKHPELTKRILEEGHVLGNHTYNHINGWKTKTRDYLGNIDEASKVINSNLFRPPYGQLTPKQGKKLIENGYQIIMWNVISLDWDKTVSKETCLSNVISKTTKGSIVVFHDSVKASKNMLFALPKVLEHFSNLGYYFKAIKIKRIAV